MISQRLNYGVMFESYKLGKKRTGNQHLPSPISYVVCQDFFHICSARHIHHTAVFASLFYPVRSVGVLKGVVISHPDRELQDLGSF